MLLENCKFLKCMFFVVKYCMTKVLVPFICVCMLCLEANLYVALKQMNFTRETLLNGKAQYSWPPCTNLSRSATFYIENIIYIINKTGYLNEEVNCTKPSPSLSIPWILQVDVISNLTCGIFAKHTEALKKGILWSKPQLLFTSSCNVLDYLKV